MHAVRLVTDPKGDVQMRQQLKRYLRVLFISGYYLLVAFPMVVSAAQLTLSWNANSPAPDGYNAYMRLDGQSYDYSAPLNATAITDTTYTVDGLTEGATYYFVVRAFVGSQESGDSNQASYTVPISVKDTDGDGYNDPVDAFPDDSSEWADTDGDGVGNNADTDDDGDGMLDAWENLYGLDPLDSSDANADLDGDGMSNLEEHDNGSDPTLVPGNSVPDKPVLAWPVNGAVNIDLMPTLMTDGFTDSDGDTHIRTRYQIATSTDWSSDLVFDGEFTLNLTSVTLPDLVLDPETTYYWRVRFYDEHNGESEWSDAWRFTTIDGVSAGYPDDDGDGVLNDQEVPADSINPELEATNEMVVVGAPDITNPQLAVLLSTDAHIISLRAMDADSVEIGSNANRPEMLTGLISFKVGLLNGANSASVTVNLITPAPEDAVWYKYHLENGWVPYPNVTFGDDRKSITIHLVDGGDGDDDGVQNGVIVDPSGLGYAVGGDNSSGISDDSSSSDSSLGDGCFISTPLSETVPYNSGNAQLLIWLGLIGIAVMVRLEGRK
jgi:hypothetical protein